MFWDNLQEACIRNGIKITPLLQELNLSTGNIGRWKKGGAVTSDALLALSERLGVTTDYLLTGKTVPAIDPVAITKNEEVMLAMYRELTDQQRGKCFSYIQGMYDSIDREQVRSVS